MGKCKYSVFVLILNAKFVRTQLERISMINCFECVKKGRGKDDLHQQMYSHIYKIYTRICACVYTCIVLCVCVCACIEMTHKFAANNVLLLPACSIAALDFSAGKCLTK